MEAAEKSEVLPTQLPLKPKAGFQMRETLEHPVKPI